MLRMESSDWSPQNRGVKSRRKRDHEDFINTTFGFQIQQIFQNEPKFIYSINAFFSISLSTFKMSDNTQKNHAHWK
jgi:hypothetical protein